MSCLFPATLNSAVCLQVSIPLCLCCTSDHCTQQAPAEHIWRYIWRILVSILLLLKFYNKNFDLLLLKFYKKSTQTTAHSNTASQKDCLTTAHDQTVARLPDIFMSWHHGTIYCHKKSTQTTAHSNTASQKDCLTTAHDQTVARLPDIFMIWHHGAIDWYAWQQCG